TVTDVDNLSLASATVSISSSTLFTGDVLAATTAGNKLTANYSSATGELTLSGSDSLANYQHVLDSVTYSSTSHNPANFGSHNTRTISCVINAGSLNNSTAHPTTLTISAVDDAPFLNEAATASYTYTLSLHDALPISTVTDVDNLSLASATVSISSSTLF